ncbi:MAG TPA: histidine phosphatase family protein [Pseudonocardiaceae bacterium]|jgi:probable phosphoglycerate mutase|nr:histidine phosphatase family protein [Pseudonocardiaceae bacterium]
MTTYLLRHGRTPLSALHQVNGDPAAQVALDEVGLSQCEDVAKAAWLETIATCATSRFLRTQQTADVLMERHPSVARSVEPRLDEINYGVFEGGPWLTYGAWLAEHGPLARPPAGHESLYEATTRMLVGLASVLNLPGSRLVVGHGHLVSLIQRLQTQPVSLAGLRLPEAAYASPIVLRDDELTACITTGQALLDQLATAEDIRLHGDDVAR